MPFITIGSCVISVGAENMSPTAAREAVNTAAGPERYESKNSSSPSALIEGLLSVGAELTSLISRTNVNVSVFVPREA